jgi:hypothetical protein
VWHFGNYPIFFPWLGRDFKQNLPEFLLEYANYLFSQIRVDVLVVWEADFSVSREMTGIVNDIDGF